jgi:hypothetical protein
LKPPQDRIPDGADDPEEDFEDGELAEFDELNSSTATSTFLDNPWFRRIGIAFAALIAIVFLVPLFLPFFGNDGGHSNSPDSDPNLVILPDFVLPSASGRDIRLSDETQRNETVVLVFYRGYY